MLISVTTILHIGWIMLMIKFLEILGKHPVIADKQHMATMDEPTK